ncbi:hypothetical protein VTK73DRAFT_3470 [Phialemonium thermophilum]|uniref:Uncharacterized protein n=1 Tax=Phialemonium thermophilum TaxID=223376 RepID=A0ABR3WYU0_9PEZI
MCNSRPAHPICCEIVSDCVAASPAAVSTPLMTCQGIIYSRLLALSISSSHFASLHNCQRLMGIAGSEITMIPRERRI